MIENKIQWIIRKSSIICPVYSNSIKKFIEKHKHLPIFKIKKRFQKSQEILDILNEIHWLNWSHEQLYRDNFWEEKIHLIYKKFLIKEKFNLDFDVFLSALFYSYLNVIEYKLSCNSNAFLMIYANDLRLYNNKIKNNTPYFENFNDFHSWLINRSSNTGDTFLNEFSYHRKTKTIYESINLSITNTFINSINKIFPKMKFNLYVALLCKFTIIPAKSIAIEMFFNEKIREFISNDETIWIELNSDCIKEQEKISLKDCFIGELDWGEFTLGFLFLSIFIPALFPLFIFYIIISIIIFLFTS